MSSETKTTVRVEFPTPPYQATMMVGDETMPRGMAIDVTPVLSAKAGFGAVAYLSVDVDGKNTMARIDVNRDGRLRLVPLS